MVSVAEVTTMATSLTPSSLSHTLTVKLSSSNYLLWKSQFMAFLRGTDLLGYVDGTKTCPPKMKVSATGESSLNPDYTDWVRYDQCVLGCILSSLTESVHVQLIRITSSRDAWLFLEKTYASQSEARVMQLRYKLIGTQKGASSMMDYLVLMKSFADGLAAVDRPVADDDLVLYVLGGLGPEYESFVTAVTTRTDKVTFTDLQGLLLSQEMRMTSSASSETLSPQANVASKVGTNSSSNGSSQNTNSSFNRGRGRGGRGGRGYNNRFSSQQQQQGYPYNNGANRSSRGGFNGSSQNPSSGQSRGLVCQVCNRVGHSALTCYNRFNESYTADSPHVMMANRGSSDSSWYPDSGANHHVTSDLGQLSGGTEYTGTEVVRVGNGSGSCVGEGSGSRNE